MSDEAEQGITPEQLVKSMPDIADAIAGAGRVLASAQRAGVPDGCEPCPQQAPDSGKITTAEADAIATRLSGNTVAADQAVRGGGGGNDLRMLLGSPIDKSFGSQFADYPSYKGFDFTRLASVSDMQADAAGANAHILGMRSGAGVLML